jgi:hypothetical protein
MPEIIADPPLPSCFRLFSAAEISEFQWLSPDFSKGWVHRDPGFEKIVLRERFVSEAGEPDADRV